MGKYPVISLSLKDVEGGDFETAYDSLGMLVSAEASRFAFLAESDRLLKADKMKLQQLIVGDFEKALGCPVGFDTDVNGAVLGEVTWGAAKGLDSAIYITVGTGVGVGVYLNGGLLHGLVHPEAGHILLSRHPADPYEGKCPFHKNCMEGLAAGPAIEARWGKKGVELTDRDEVCELEAYYIAQAIMDYILVYSPQKIILWGGVMHQEKLFPMVREEVKRLLNGYVSHEAILDSIEDYIVPPALGEDPGIKGAIRLGVLA